MSPNEKNDSAEADLTASWAQGLEDAFARIDRENDELRATLLPLRKAAFALCESDPKTAAEKFTELSYLARSIAADRDWYEELAGKCRRMAKGTGGRRRRDNRKAG